MIIPISMAGNQAKRLTTVHGNPYYIAIPSLLLQPSSIDHTPSSSSFMNKGIYHTRSSEEYLAIQRSLSDQLPMHYKERKILVLKIFQT
jgi:hypothetical protein